MPSPTSELKLDPGPSPRRRSKLSCRCFLWTIVAAVCLITSYFSVLFLQTAVKLLRAPQLALYQDLTVSYKPNEVVRPLVDSNQTFDIVATVWIRKPEDERKELGGSVLLEEAIYSDTVFRGLQLKDKNVKASVNLSVPTAVFKNPLRSYDLRATFVLIPNSPSPLDFAVNYSSWMPPSMYHPPMRPSTDENRRALTDQVIDSYGILVPLLEFHPVASKCDEQLPTVEDLTENDDDDDWNMQPPSSTAQPNATVAPLYQSTNTKSILEAHPYIATRTSIRVMDMTAIFNRKAYDAAHRKLALKACEVPVAPFPKAWTHCQKTIILTHGNLETKVKLRVPKSDGVGTTKEWAYAPYLTFSEAASGPKDLVPVPVNREPCLVTKTTESSVAPPAFDEPEFMNITWNIAFSGRTPVKLLAANSFGSALQRGNLVVALNATEYDQVVRQEFHDSISGLFGHTVDEESHPRLLFLTHVIGLSLFMCERFLSFIYWYTRSSTVGISIKAVYMFLLYVLVNHPVGVAMIIATSDSESLGVWDWVSAIFFRSEVLFSVSAIWMLKAATRADIYYTGWRPRVRFLQATHAERASDRVDGRTSNRLILLTFAALSVVYTTTIKYAIYLISSPGLRRPAPEKEIAQTLNVIGASLTLPALTLTIALQVVFNYHAKTFAGAYRPAAAMHLMVHVYQALVNIPGLFGSSALYSGLLLNSVTDMLLAGALAWQALIYLPASQKEEEVEE